MSRLDAIPVLVAARDRPGAFGRDDCFTLAMAVAAAVTGRPAPYAEFIGRYTTPLGASRHMKKLGFADLGQAYAAVPGWIENDPPGRGALGDLGVAAGPDGLATVFHAGSGWLAREAGYGLVPVRRAQVLRSWSLVGEADSEGQD